MKAGMRKRGPGRREVESGGREVKAAERKVEGVWRKGAGGWGAGGKVRGENGGWEANVRKIEAGVWRAIGRMWLGFPVVMWFSYQPNWQLAVLSTMNLEVSVVLAWLAVMFGLVVVAEGMRFLEGKLAEDGRGAGVAEGRSGGGSDFIEGGDDFRGRLEGGTGSRADGGAGGGMNKVYGIDKKCKVCYNGGLGAVWREWGVVFLVWGGLILNAVGSENVLRGVLTAGIYGMMVGIMGFLLKRRGEIWGMNARRTEGLALEEEMKWGEKEKGAMLEKKKRGAIPEEMARLEQERAGRRWVRILWGMTVVMSGVCVGQMVMDVMGVGREVSLMCRGCGFGNFGWPRPTGFAIEPQFMGNLLIAPVMLALFGVISGGVEGKFSMQKMARVVLVVGTGAVVLTLSRGAIFGLVLGSGVMMLWMILEAARRELRRMKEGRRMKGGRAERGTWAGEGGIWAKKLGRGGNFWAGEVGRGRKLWVGEVGRTVRGVGVGMGMMLGAGVGAIGVMGMMAEVAPVSETFWSATAKAVHQLTLGRVDWRGERGVGEGGSGSEEPGGRGARFDGYVAESTNIRLNLAKTAIKTWGRDMKTRWLGVGIGGSGRAMFRQNPSLGSPKEIVQNQFLEWLLEGGMVGVLMVIGVGVWMLRLARVPRQYWGLLMGVGVGYGVTLMFFSGLPNALHVYLLPVMMVGVMRDF